jgi:hypothetical protein
MSIYSHPPVYSSNARYKRPLKRPLISDPYLMAWYIAEPGSNWRDLSGRGHDLTNNGPVLKKSGPYGWAWWFDNIDDSFSTGDHTDFDLAEVWTLLVWCKYDDLTSGASTLIDKWKSAGNERGYQLAVNNGRLDLWYSIDGINGLSCVIASVIDTSWCHIATTYLFPGNINHYVNGVLKKTKATTGAIFNNAQDFMIGAHTVSEPWDGLISEVKIYKRELNIEEIKQHYRAGKPHLEAV